MHLDRAVRIRIDASVCISRDASIGVHLDTNTVRGHGNIAEIVAESNLLWVTAAATHVLHSVLLLNSAHSGSEFSLMSTSIWKYRSKHGFSSTSPRVNWNLRSPPGPLQAWSAACAGGRLDAPVRFIGTER